MCYEFDRYITKARIAEQMRMKKPVADELTRQRGTAVPTVPAELAKTTKEEQPVSA